jgi:4-amino-4-deoxy-L-arabinose transferase-like glycosyltransferase
VTIILLIIGFIGIFILFLSFGQAWREALLRTCLTVAGLIFVGTEVLSLLNAITPAGIAIFWSLVAIAVTVVVIINRKRLPLPLLREKSFSLHWLQWLMITGVLVIVVINVYVAVQTPPNNWDSMVYHLPRIEHWLQNRSVDFYATHVNRQLFLSPGFEYVLLHVRALSGSDIFLNLTGVLVWLAAAVAVSELARLLKAQATGQLLAGLLALLLPTGILYASTTKNELYLGFWILTALVFFLHFKANASWQNAVAFGAAIALGVHTKTTAYILLLPVVVWFVVWGLRNHNGSIWRYGAAITLLFLVINLPHAVRNQQLYGRFLGPQEETVYYHNESYGVRVLVSNALRNLAMHLRATEGWNRILYHGLASIHDVMEIDISYNRTTWPGYEFSLPAIRFNEDETGAPFHLILFVICVTVWLFRRRKQEDNDLIGILLVLVSGFLLFSGYLRWQFWVVRLMISLGLMASVIIGVLLERIRKHWLHAGIIFLNLVFAAFCLYKNPTKPLPVVYDYNIANLPRVLSMIYPPALQPDYMEVLELLNREMTCDQVGLVTDNGDWEYPFWVEMRKYHSDLRIEHVLVENDSARLMDESFSPCVVLVMTEQRPQILSLQQDLSYESFRQLKQIGVYLPTSP